MSPAGITSSAEKKGKLEISLSLPAKGECSLVGTREGQDRERDGFHQLDARQQCDLFHAEGAC